MNETPDRIEKEILIRAPRSRVWKAISDRGEFGRWFGALMGEGAFAPRQSVDVGMTNPKYSHVKMAIDIVDVEPESRLSYRWHPFAIDVTYDYSDEPKTLVTFTLEDASEGTLLRVVESGFDAIPLARRSTAWKMNDGGWAAQVQNVARYVTATE